MHAGKVLLLVLVGGVLLAGALFALVPSSRPAMVKKWFHQARGFTPANSAEDALDKLKKAVEARDYEAAQTYVTGDYLEFLIKGGPDASQLVAAIDELKSVMKDTGTKSDKVDVLLFRLDPFPTFKYTVNKTSGGTTATITWAEELARFKDVQSGYSDLKPDVLKMYHLLLPVIPTNATLTVPVKETGGVWKVELPAGVGARHMRAAVEELRKNATNVRNALRDIKQNIKNNPAVKEDFEREFKSNLEKAL